MAFSSSHRILKVRICARYLRSEVKKPKENECNRDPPAGVEERQHSHEAETNVHAKISDLNFAYPTMSLTWQNFVIEI